MHRSLCARSSAAVGAVLMAAGLIACQPGAAATPEAASAPAPVAAAPGTPIDVEVTVGEYAITPTLTTFQTGVPYRFIVTNKGLLAHQFRIMPRGDTAEMIAQIGAGAQMAADHHHPGELVSMTAEQLPPGGSAEIKAVFLAPGDYEITCHVTGHAEAGMVIPITIAGEAFAGAAAGGEVTDGQVIVDTSLMSDMPCHRMGTTIMGRCTGVDIERLMGEMRTSGQLHGHGEGTMMGGGMMGGTMPMTGTMPMMDGMPMMGRMPMSGTMPMTGTMPMMGGSMPMAPGADHGHTMGGTTAPTRTP